MKMTVEVLLGIQLEDSGTMLSPKNLRPSGRVYATKMAFKALCKILHEKYGIGLDVVSQSAEAASSMCSMIANGDMDWEENNLIRKKREMLRRRTRKNASLDRDDQTK